MNNMKNEIVSALKKAYLDECSDVEMYLTLAEKMGEEPSAKSYCSILKRIAHDEYEHKCYLLEILEQLDAFMPDDFKKATELADNAYYHSK